MINWHAIIDFIAHWYWILLTLIYVGVIITILFVDESPPKTENYNNFQEEFKHNGVY
jgi:uncharacterized membrane-anchored protein YhcB (DUF1043 family)